MPNYKVTSTQFKQRFGDVRREAFRGPVTITHHGRDDMVVLSHEQYVELRAAPPAVPVHEVQAVRTVDLGPEVLASLRGGTVPEATRAFDDELEEPGNPS